MFPARVAWPSRDRSGTPSHATGEAAGPVCCARPASRSRHDRVAVGSRRAINVPVLSRRKARPSSPMAWLRSSASDCVTALGVRQSMATARGIRPAACGYSPTLPMEPRRQPLRIIVRAPKRNDRRGAHHDKHQCDERRENEDADRQRIRTGRASRGVVTPARFPDPLAVPDRAFSDVSRDLRPEPSQPPAKRQSDQKSCRARGST